AHESLKETELPLVRQVASRVARDVDAGVVDGNPVDNISRVAAKLARPQLGAAGVVLADERVLASCATLAGKGSVRASSNIDIAVSSDRLANFSTRAGSSKLLDPLEVCPGGNDPIFEPLQVEDGSFDFPQTTA